jgi:hypothetical protein
LDNERIEQRRGGGEDDIALNKNNVHSRLLSLLQEESCSKSMTTTTCRFYI